MYALYYSIIVLHLMFHPFLYDVCHIQVKKLPVHSVQQQKPYTATVCNGTVQLKLKFRPNPSSAKACLVPRIGFFSYVLKANVANTLLKLTASSLASHKLLLRETQKLFSPLKGGRCNMV